MKDRLWKGIIVCVAALCVAVPSRGEEQSASDAGSREDAVLKKMKEIRIPELEFQQADVRDVLDFIQETSVGLDKAKRGVNIVLLPGPPRDPGSRAGAPSATPDNAAAAPTRITFKAKDMSLEEVIRAVTAIAKLKYRIEGNVVKISPADAPEPVSPGLNDEVVSVLRERAQTAGLQVNRSDTVVAGESGEALSSTGGTGPTFTPQNIKPARQTGKVTHRTLETTTTRRGSSTGVTVRP